MESIEVTTEGGGILSFDGRVFVFFDDRQRTSAWRIHAAHVLDWELEPRKGMSRVKVMVAKRNFQNVLVEDTHLPAFERLRVAVDAVRG